MREPYLWGLPMAMPRMLALLLCHAVTQDDDGRPVLQGLYDRVALRALPGVDTGVVYTKYELPPGDRSLMLAVVELESGREIGRAQHRVTITSGRPVNETTWSITVRFERIGQYMYRFLADDELLGFTIVEVVTYPTPTDS
jgi:hypothetical protein